MTDEWTAPEFGLKAALGFALENRDGRSIAVLEISGVHLNPNGVVHGAVPVAMMDTTMGDAVMNTIDDDRRCATIEMQTRYHRPVAAGALTATAEVITAGRRVVHLRAETRDDNDRLVASATASFAIIEP